MSKFPTNHLLKCAQYAQLTYLENIHLLTPTNININIHKGYIFKEKDKLFISFRGLKSIGDGMNCINAIPKEISTNMYVHSGYYNCYIDMKPHILDIIADNPTIDDIIFLGHSMGGSISTIAAYDVQMQLLSASKKNKKNISCVTFGSPPIGNTEFVKKYNSIIENSYRVTNNYDIIPSIPIYKHVKSHIPIIRIEERIDQSYNINKRYIKPHKIEHYIDLLSSRKNKQVLRFNKPFF